MTSVIFFKRQRYNIDSKYWLPSWSTTLLTNVSSWNEFRRASIALVPFFSQCIDSNKLNADLFSTIYGILLFNLHHYHASSYLTLKHKPVLNKAFCLGFEQYTRIASLKYCFSSNDFARASCNTSYLLSCLRASSSHLFCVKMFNLIQIQSICSM